MSTNARLGIDIVATDKTAAAFSSVQKFMAQTGEAQKRMAGLAAPMQQAAANSNQFASKVQNLSFQVQDFAVQVAAGTSVTKAFGQQAPQLLSGFGLVGAILGTVAAVAIPLAGYFLSSADAMGSLSSAIQPIAPYAAVATAALAGFYAPSLLAGIATTSSAIGVGLVGSIRAVTAAMMANPLGLIVAGVAAAAVAIFAFRDDIKQVFGVDFVGVIKDATNWTIDKLVKLTQSIGVTWSHVGDIVGNAMVGAANYVVSAIGGMVNVGIQGVNKLIGAVNSLSEYTGVTLDTFAEIEAYQFTNPYASGAAKVGAELGQIWAQTQVKDYVGTMGALAGDAMSKVMSMFSGPGTAEASGNGTKQRAPRNTIGDIYGVGMLDKTFNELWKKMAAGVQQTDQLTQSFQKMADTVVDGLTSGLQGLISGTTGVKDAFASMAQGIDQEITELAKSLIKSGIFRVLSMLGQSLGGGGGVGVSFAGMSFGGFYANGGTLGAGKWGIAGEAGVPEIIHGPAQITPLSKLGGSTSVHYAPQITIQGNADQRVIAQALAASEARMRQELPAMIREDRKRGRI